MVQLYKNLLDRLVIFISKNMRLLKCYVFTNEPKINPAKMLFFWGFKMNEQKIIQRKSQ